jgi:hypothetical protein
MLSAGLRLLEVFYSPIGSRKYELLTHLLLRDSIFLTHKYFYCYIVKNLIKRCQFMAKSNKEIKKKYQLYSKLVEDKKIILISPITLNRIRENQRNYRQENALIAHPSSLENEVILIIESRVNNDKDFKFKLRCVNLCGEPFFRFDSDGDTHRNSNVPLAEQQITTPHFHKFNDEGFNVAYKTDKLNDPNEALALEDINLCVIHFCHEGNLRYRNDEFPEIIQNAQELAIKMPDWDPLSGLRLSL